MTVRLKLLIVGGLVLIGVTGWVSILAVRHARVDVSAYSSYLSGDWGRGNPREKGPIVLLGYDGPWWKVTSAIRIDVRKGVPHTRADEAPITDVVRYVTEQLDAKPADWVVVTASTDEKLGDIMRVIDECQKTRIHGIVLNQFPETWRAAH